MCVHNIIITLAFEERRRSTTMAWSAPPPPCYSLPAIPRAFRYSTRHYYTGIYHNTYARASTGLRVYLYAVPTRNTRIIRIGIPAVTDRITTIVVIHPIVCVCASRVVGLLPVPFI